jgi:cyclic pyranopterin phosphate synthase
MGGPDGESGGYREGRGMTTPIHARTLNGLNPGAGIVADRFARPLRSLRLSVTDRCNLRCRYCMPEAEYQWLPRSDLLSFEEIHALTEIFAECGVDRVRFTGGEPLLRADLPTLVRMIAGIPAIRDLALTTNGVLLEENVAALKAAGLHRVTVSLDSLDPDRFAKLTRRDLHARVLRGIASLADAGFENTKIDSVVMRGHNDDELVPLIEFGKRANAEVRFIEYMDVGGATHWSWDQVMSRQEMLDAIAQAYGAVEPLPPTDAAPAERFRLPDGTTFGIIASTTAPFCRSCDRSRLTADGVWYLCLYAQTGADLRTLVRSSMGRDELRERISLLWRARTDRGAEVRHALDSRGVLVGIERLRSDPHLEMHTRGG